MDPDHLKGVVMMYNMNGIQVIHSGPSWYALAHFWPSGMKVLFMPQRQAEVQAENKANL